MKSKSKNLLKVLSTVLLLLAVAVSTICAVSFGDGVANADGTTVSVWNGSVDTSWYVDGQNEFTLTTAAQLAGLSKIVNDGNSLDGVTIKLGADIDLNGRAEGDAEWVLTNADYTAEGYDEANVSVNSNLVWNPIGGKYNAGIKLSCTIDGQGHTISKMFSINKSNGDASQPRGAGFIGAPHGGLGFSVKNVVFDDCLAMSTTSGEDLVGIVAGYNAYYSSARIPSVENVTVKNSIVRGDNAVGVFFGQVESSNIRNCTAMNNTVYGNATNSAIYIGGFFGRISDSNKYAVFENNKLIGSKLYLPETSEISGLWGGFFGASTFTNCSSDSADPVTSDDCIGKLTNNGYIIGLESLTFDGIDGLSNVSASDTGVLQYYVSANAPIVEMKFMGEVSMVDFSINGVTSTAYTLDTTGKILTIDSLPDSVNDIVFKVSMIEGASELDFRIVTGYTEMPELVRLIDGVTIECSPNFILNHEGFSYIMNSSSTDANVLTLSFATPLDENAKVIVTDQNGVYTITGSDVVNLGNISTIGVYMIEYYYMDVLTYVEVFNDYVVLESLGQDGFYTIVSDEYPWQKVTADDPTNIFGFEYYKSSDNMKGVSVSESVFEIFVVGYYGINYSFTQSSEEKWDYLYVEVNGEMIEYKDSSDSITPSELVWTDCIAEFIDSSLNIVRFVYKKDSSTDKGLDQAFIKGLSALDSFDVSSVTTGKIRTTVNGVTSESEFAINDVLEFSFYDKNSALIFAPVLNQGETCYVYINGEKGEQALSEEMGYYFYNVASFTARTEVKFVYTRDNTVSFRFLVTLDTLIQGTIQDNIVKSGNVTVSCDDYQDYPMEFDSTVSTADRIAYKSTNSGTDKSASGLSLTVTESGVLSFEYMVSSEAKYDIVACALDKVLTYDNYKSNVLTGDRSSASGVVDWTTFKLPVSVPAGQTVTVHIAYVKDGGGAKNLDMFAIANVEFFVGQNTLKYSATNSDAGTITATADGVAIDSEASVNAGSLISLTATPNDGYYFYGWKDMSTGSIIPESTVKFYLIDDVEYVAIMESKGAYVLFGGSNYYSTLSEGFASSDETLYLLQNLTISEDITVPQNKTLIIKMSESDKSGYVEGGSYARLPWLSGLSPYITLTIENGKTLTVNGKIIVGGTQHKTDQSGQGHTSGAYSQIVNNGSIVVGDGGYLDIIGRVTGNGTLTVNSGATLREPFVVTNYAGGTNTQNLYTEGQFPFVQFATVNIDIKQTIYHGAKVIGSTSLYFWSSITTQDVILVDKLENKTSSSEGSLIWLESGSRLEITQNNAKTINQTVGNIHLGDYGITVIDVYGFITAGEFYLQGYGSGEMVLAIPYTYNFNIKDGAKVTVNQAYKIMPGAVVTVENGGTVDITSTGTLYVYDGLIQAQKSGKLYPSADVLDKFGFAKSGMLYVNGTLNIDGAFAGIVQGNNNGGTIVVGNNANVGTQKIIDGANGGYTNNETIFNMTGRVYGLNSLVELEKGKTYKYLSEKDYVLSTFTVVSAKECPSLTVTLNQALKGRFLVWNGEKYVVDATFGIGEATQGVKVYLEGNLYQTDENGLFTSTLYFADKNDTNIAYHGEKSVTDYIHVFDFDGEHVLTNVAKAVALSDTNAYTRKMTSANTIAQDFVLNAIISFYGSGTTETVALTFDSTALNGTYIHKDVALTTDKLVESLKHDLLVWNSTVAQYRENVDALSQDANIIVKAVELFDTYNSLLVGSAEDIRLVTDYLSDSIEYASVIVKSISPSVVPTYGDEPQIDVSITYVNGSTANAIGSLANWESKDNRLSVSVVYSGTYKTESYSVSATCTAKRKNVTVTIDDKTSIYGDPIATLTATSTELAYEDTFADLGVVLTKAEGTSVGNYNIGGTWTNLLYQVEFIENTYTITQREAIVTIDDKSTVYGEEIAVLTASVSGLASGEDLSILKVVLTKENGKSAGVYAITGVYDNANYNVTFKNGSYTITKYVATVQTKALTDVLISRVTAVALTSSAVAPDTNFASTLEYRVEKDGELYATVKNGVWTVSQGKTITEGVYTIVATTDNANYTIGSQNAVNMTVVSAKDYYQVDFDLISDGKVYDGKQLEINPTVKVRDTQREVSEYRVAITLDGSASAVKNVGKYLITVTVTEENEEYSFVANYTITQREAVIKIEDKSTVYGEEIAELTATANGLAEGEDLSTLKVVLTKENGKTVGNYAITGVYDNANYNATFVDGVYTITPKTITIVIQDKTANYGEKLLALESSTTDALPYNESYESLGIVLKKAEGLSAGEYSITMESYSNKNYNVVVEKDGVYTINKLDLRIAVDNKSTVYGEDLLELTYNVTGNFASGEDEKVLNASLKIDGVAKDVGTYAIVFTYDNVNYNATVQNGEYKITQRAVTVKVENISSVYGERIPDYVLTVVEGSMVYEDDVFGLVELSRESGSTVGEYKIKSIDESKNANYNVKVVYTTAENSVYTITKRPITVEVNSILNVSYTIDWATLSEKFGYSITEGNLVGKDVLNVEYSVIVKDEKLDESNFSEKIVGGTHTITMKAVQENYEITIVDGTLTVSLPTIALTDKVQGLTFVYGNTQNVFDWKTMLSGYMQSASDRTFRAEFFAENDLETPVELDGAGLYKMQIVIVHESEYNFDNGTKRSDYINVVVTKADITSSILITVEGLTAKGYVVLSFGLTADASAEGYDVELNSLLQKNGSAVEEIDGIGEYVFTATVEDANYSGSKSISFKVVDSAREKIEKIERTATLEKLNDADYKAVQELLSSLTEDDRLQIEDDESATESLETIRTLSAKYVEAVRSAVEQIKKGYDEYLSLTAKPHGRFAIRTLYAEVQALTDTQKTLLTDQDNALIKDVHNLYLASEKQVSAMLVRIRELIEKTQNGDEENLLKVHDYIVGLQGDDLTIVKESQEGKEYADLWGEFVQTTEQAISISQKVENNILAIILIPTALSMLAFAVAKMLGM